MSDEVRVGSTLWRFDENRRHYETDANGRACGHPIWREHWVKESVVGETSRSWLVGSGWSPIKLPKAALRNGKCPSGWARSEKQLDELAWLHEHRSRILHKVTYLEDYAAMVKVAEAVGYEPAGIKGGR